MVAPNWAIMIRAAVGPGRIYEGALMKTVDRSLGAFFWSGVTVSLARPGQAWRFVRTIAWQATAARTRKAWAKRGVKVPPIVIFSVTHQCNLSCAGCYAQSFLDGRTADCAEAGGPPELSDAKLRDIVGQADELGVSLFVVAGGEPFMREELLSIAGRFPRVVFLVFTNGLLLDDALVDRVARVKNIVPLLSLEGSEAHTDERRGAGTYERLVASMARLRKRGVFFGCSLTLTSRNFSTIFSDEYVGDLRQAGCRLFLFADYTPVEAGTEDWVLSDAQRDQAQARVKTLRDRHKALFVAVPWDEAEVGGCLSAGRGFVHINASGGVEPCPFAPFSDADLTEVSLLEALKSPFLARLRDMPELVDYQGAGCELWKNRAQVERVLAETRGSAG
jgi:MoaA/NifB/PqqE/SkfB family radical SAM enzyme